MGIFGSPRQISASILKNMRLLYFAVHVRKCTSRQGNKAGRPLVYSMKLL